MFQYSSQLSETLANWKSEFQNPRIWTGTKKTVLALKAKNAFDVKLVSKSLRKVEIKTGA
jgi:hypothetical protein